MFKVTSDMFDTTRPVVVAAEDGVVIAQNKSARRLLGPGTGKKCWDVVGGLENARRLPCRRGCVGELIASSDDSRNTQFRLDGNRHFLSCSPVNGVVVCMLGAECMASLKKGRSVKVHPALSNREREILLLLANGDTTASLAEQLGVSGSTIRTHVERMRSKLCVNTRAAVVAEGFRLGYLD